MVRLARERFLRDGEYYHVFTRGNDRRRIFRTAGDHIFFLETVSEYQKKFEVGVVHYCLMPNHIHLLIKAEKAKDLPKFMQVILQVYAGYFKRRYKSVGFVFQNRYKSLFIKEQIYLLECGRYIERNPLRAKLVEELENYRWSSYHYYVSGKSDPIIKYCNPLYLYLDNVPEKRREFYKKLFFEERLYELIVDEKFRIS